MTPTEKKPSRGPMIHIRLEEDLHRALKVQAAREGTTIQGLVAGLIRQRLEAPATQEQPRNE